MDVYDVIVIGGGAGGLTAACVAAAERQRVLLVERSAVIGGTTAISGGMVWIPANHKMAEAGIDDSLDAARLYLNQTLPPDNARIRETFLARGDEAIRYLDAKTSVHLRPVRVYPDYYPDLPGGTAGGRVLEPVPYDGRELGKSFALLRPPLADFTLFGGMMISREDIPHLRRAGRSLASAWRVSKLVGRYALQRLSAPRGTTLYLGNALVARLLKSALDLDVELALDTAVAQLLRENGRIAGIEIAGPDGRRTLRARRGVVLATGGISQDESLRREHVPRAAGHLTATVASGAAKTGVALALAAGAQMCAGGENGAFWVPCSRYRRRDGSEGVYPHIVTDRAKPGLIAVDATGRRFVNEAVSYHDFGWAQLRAGKRAIPAYLVCDKRFLWKYGLGRVKPFTLAVAPYVASGYLKSAPTLAGLAAALGIPADAFVATVAAFNADARQGLDREFGRGTNIYQRHLGDAEHRPNPCVAPIETGPFYAVAVYPADLGMSAGLITDELARVLDRDGAPIPGLYACGNDMNSFMNGAYPGPGITLGPAMTFGYIAAKHAAAD